MAETPDQERTLSSWWPRLLSPGVLLAGAGMLIQRESWGGAAFFTGLAIAVSVWGWRSRPQTTWVAWSTHATVLGATTLGALLCAEALRGGEFYLAALGGLVPNASLWTMDAHPRDHRHHEHWVAKRAKVTGAICLGLALVGLAELSITRQDVAVLRAATLEQTKDKGGHIHTYKAAIIEPGWDSRDVTVRSRSLYELLQDGEPRTVNVEVGVISQGVMSVTVGDRRYDVSAGTAVTRSIGVVGVFGALAWAVWGVLVVWGRFLRWRAQRAGEAADRGTHQSAKGHGSGW